MAVDDEIDDIEVLTEAFLQVQPQLSVLSCQSGTQCIEKLASTVDTELPGMLVLDYNISDMDGADVLKRIFQLQRYAVITKVVWSTSDSEQDQECCLVNGAHRYYKKPSTFPAFIEMADNTLKV